MTTTSKTLDQLLTDQEGVQISSTHVLSPTSRVSRRTTSSFSEMKVGKFRRKFNRHQYVSQ